MTDYEKLVKALRERARREDEYYEHGGDVINDAAAAIESLQAQLGKVNKTADKWKREHDAIYDIARIIILQRKCATIPEDGYYELKDGHMHKLEQQLPKRGKWIDDDFTSKGRCSVCGEEWSWFDNCMETFKYCPNCGAKMTEVQE